ncbi:hypothetical protein [Actinomadura keratinilytica]|uniref:hypothetical protein n=1 Tax=Actinomadura keratinilytica TaxID=547461 RepID=UPI003610A696
MGAPHPGVDAARQGVPPADAGGVARAGHPHPRRSSLIRPYTLPLHRDRQERNWVVLAHLRELDRDSDQLARIIRTYAGSRWQE